MEIQAGVRALLAQARGHQLAEPRKQLSLACETSRRRWAKASPPPRSNPARSPRSR